MRVYNGTNSTINLPLNGSLRISIPAKSVSGDIMPSNEFLSLLVGSYDYDELALIVSGPFEINMCAGVSGSTGFVVQSLEEAIERFSPKPAAPVEKPAPKPEPEPTPIKIEEPKEVVVEEKSEVEEPVVEETPVVEPAAEEKPVTPLRRRRSRKA